MFDFSENRKSELCSYIEIDVAKDPLIYEQIAEKQTAIISN